MKTLKLFNAVVAKKSKDMPHVSDQGYIIESGALWAKDRIVDYYKKETLNGNDLNKTFHKSWKVIRDSSRFDLFVHQIIHYFSTYGTNFEGEIYLPDEVLNVPEIKLKYKVIKAYTPKEMTDKCLNMLRSGIALKEETLDELLTILVDELKYSFTGDEGIRNKEAIVKIADMYGVLPKDTMEFFRYIIYRATGESLLIKDGKTIAAIKDSTYNPSAQFNKFGTEKLAEIFNRFKPLFLAFKRNSSATINKIGKLSKKYHKPLVSNPLNTVTSTLLSTEDLHWLENATPYALFKALSACKTRAKGQDAFVYRIRNGKSWVKDKSLKPNSVSTSLLNGTFLMNFMKEKYSLEGVSIYLPKGVEYALPTSEKMFVGNIPTGTKFSGKKLAVGIYWENSWGARDLDLSGVNIGGKVGWNSNYKNSGGSLYFSGDIVDAPTGAVEYLYATKGLNTPTLVMNNVYTGQNDCDYKIVVGKGSKISKDYMMNPNKVFAEMKTKSVEKQTVLGIFLPKDEDTQTFVLLNFGAGAARVSQYGAQVETSTRALYQQWTNALMLEEVVEALGATIVEDKETANVDLSLDALEKDTFTKLLSTTPILEEA